MADFMSLTVVSTMNISLVTHALLNCCHALTVYNIVLTTTLSTEIYHAGLDLVVV